MARAAHGITIGTFSIEFRSYDKEGNFFWVGVDDADQQYGPTMAPLDFEDMDALFKWYQSVIRPAAPKEG